jgi:hypothetical protein
MLFRRCLFGSTFEQTCERLQQVLHRIEVANVKLKASKCHLFESQVKFLGFIVSRDGISVDPEKTRVISRWPVPRNITEVRAFTALCSYHRRHIFRFAEIAKPLYDLTKKGKKFEWGEQQEAAFMKLKECLTSAPVLASPIDNGAYFLDTDASGHSLSTILYQEQEGIKKVISYASRVLQPAERRYCSTRLELLAVVFGLKQYRHFLLCRKFIIRTDNAALTSLMKTPEPLAQQGRWLDLISEFDFQIVHRAAVSNGAADVLSRRPCERDDIGKMCSQCRPKEQCVGPIASPAAVNEQVTDEGDHCRVISGRSEAAAGALPAGNCGPQSPPMPVDDASSATVTSGLAAWTSSGDLSRETLEREQGRDEAISRIIELPRIGDSIDWSTVTEYDVETQALFAQRQTLEIREGILYRQFQKSDGIIDRYQAVVPKSMRLAVLAHVHGGLLTGHFGQLKSEKRLVSFAYWPGWKSDLTLFVSRCEKCNRFRKNQNVKQGLMKYSGVNAPWQKVHIDLMGPFVKSNDGYSFIMTVVCSFTKYLIAVPLREKSAFAVARALVRQVFLVFSPVELLVHDNGGEFCNSLQASINQLLDIQSCRVTRYRPSGNGVVERSHAILNRLIATSVTDNQKNWSDCLPYVVYAYNTAYHCSTTFTPFYLMFLREPRMGIDMVSEEFTAAKFASQEDYTHLMRQRMQDAYRLVHENLKTGFARAKRRYDMRVKECRFRVGDRVWYFSPRKYRNRSPKWLLQTSGPFEVIRKLNDVNCVIRKSPRHPSFTVHIDRLRPYSGPLSNVQSSVETAVKRPITCAESDELGQCNRQRPSRQSRPPRHLADFAC